MSFFKKVLSALISSRKRYIGNNLSPKGSCHKSSHVPCPPKDGPMSASRAIDKSPSCSYNGTCSSQIALCACYLLGEDVSENSISFNVWQDLYSTPNGTPMMLHSQIIFISK